MQLWYRAVLPWRLSAPEHTCHQPRNPSSSSVSPQMSIDWISHISYIVRSRSLWLCMPD